MHENATMVLFIREVKNRPRIVVDSITSLSD